MNGDIASTMKTRREALRVVGLGAGLAAAPSAAAWAMSETASAATAPTLLDLERYYAFLWHEFGDLSAEMGVEKFSSYVAGRNGSLALVKASCAAAPPSSRALIILGSLGRGLI